MQLFERKELRTACYFTIYGLLYSATSRTCTICTTDFVSLSEFVQVNGLYGPEAESSSWITVVTVSPIGCNDMLCRSSTNGEIRSIWREAYQHVTVHLINV